MFSQIISSLQLKYIRICKQGRLKLEEANLRNLPKYPGIYIFYLEGKPFYVGRSNCIRTRLLRQHLSPKNENASSSFRLHLLRGKYVKSYGEIRKWVLDNCTFKFIEIDNYDDSILLEALLIKLWRKKYKLLNDNKYEL